MNWFDRLAVAAFSLAIVIWLALFALLWLLAQVLPEGL